MAVAGLDMAPTPISRYMTPMPISRVFRVVLDLLELVIFYCCGLHTQESMEGEWIRGFGDSDFSPRYSTVVPLANLAFDFYNFLLDFVNFFFINGTY